jgi:N-acetylglucosamine-6-phosphate deacetylase
VRTAGLFDLQVNGFAGVDFNSGTLTAAALDEALEAMLRTGVTACLPTIITAHEHELATRFAALDEAVATSRLGPVMCPGYHLEGPFLNPAPGYCGCHPADAMRVADAALVERLAAPLRRPILLVTMAPEIEGGLDLAGALSRSGRAVAVGHSSAGPDVIAAAAAAGATLATHLGNGLPQLLPKLANPIFAQLGEDRLAGTFIADGIHVPAFALRSLVRAKGLSRTILVSDATAAAAMPPGRYRFAGMTVERDDAGTVRLPGGAGLAGSSLCMDDAVRNLVRFGIADPAQAVETASAAPARVLRAALSRFGSPLAPSSIAWTEDLRVAAVTVGAVERRFVDDGPRP